MNAVTNKLASAFRRNGNELYLVGGSVRDSFLGLCSKDMDFTTKANPSTIKAILRDVSGVEALWDQGEKFGTIGALVDSQAVEITTFRSDRYESGSRKPEVEFGDNIIDDLSRRDFTINAMAECLTVVPGNPVPLIDPFYGKRDIQDRMVRFVGIPELRIKEDPLRMLRAVRFHANLAFSLDVAARQGIRNCAHLIQEISKERVFEELAKMLLGPSPSMAIRVMKDVDLLKYVLPEIDILSGVEQDSRWHDMDVFGHTMDVLEKSFTRLDLRLAALFHDSGKADTQQYHAGQKITFHGHEKMSAAIANKVLRGLKVDNALRGRVVHLCKMHMRPLAVMNSGASKKAIRKFIRDCYDNKYGITVYDVLDLNLADVLAHRKPDIDNHNALRREVNLIQQEAPVQELKSPLNGTEVMALFPGRKQGMWIGYTLRHLTEAVVCGTLDREDKDTATDMAVEYVEREFANV